MAPDLMLVEAASALCKRVMIRKELSADEATLIYRDLLTRRLHSVLPGRQRTRLFKSH
ncbi:MAG TPA: hypothetical protein VIX14_13675 [Terriglobales bacterium]